jgi:inhibitor of cysteine peptidase
MAEIELDEADAGTTREVAVGDELVVILDEIPTSGYRWAFESFDNSILAARDDSFEPPEPGRLGAFGRHRFRFAVVGAGSTALTLARRRSWDAEAAAERFEARIEASPASTHGAAADNGPGQ